MNRQRFYDFRTRVADYANSVGSPLGVCVNDIPALAGMVNAVTEAWLYDPLQPEDGWWWTWARMVFTVTRANPYITAPRGVARLMVMDVCKIPTKVQNDFYEFLDYGPGLQPKGCVTSQITGSGACNQLLQTYERETVQTLGAFAATPQIIRIFPSDSRDVGATVIVQGPDQNGKTVLDTDANTGQPILGEIVSLELPFIDTVSQFSAITGLQKDSTYGPVTFQQVDPNTGTATALSAMEPSELVANYRRYLVNGLPDNCCNIPGGIPQVTALAKLDFIPVKSDPDYLMMPNIPALIAGCEALRYSSMDNTNAQRMADAKHAKALSLMMGQLDHFMGKERAAITVPIFGAARLKPQPI